MSARFFLTTLALLLPLAAAGCTPTRYGAARFSSTPPGAEVFNVQDKAPLGLTPLTVIRESDTGEPEHVTVLLRKIGYDEASASFWLNTRYESPEDARADPQPVHVILQERN